MQRSEDIEKQALELLPLGVVMADAQGRVALANASARVLLGLDSHSADEVLLRCEGRRVSLGELLRDHARGTVARQRLALEHGGHGLLSAALTRVGDGPAVGVHLTVRRSPQRDWRWAGRSDPLAAFAHEFRNALTSLREGTALLCEGAAGELTAAQERLFTGICHDADRMARLTGDMLAASQVRAGRIRVAAARVAVSELLADVARSFEAAATRAGVHLELGPLDEGAACHADRDLLAQALSNLLGNALKFTPRGGRVCLEARRGQAAGEEIVEIAVRDTGPGLDTAAMAHALGRGEPPKASLAPSGSGLGIGLAIAREIIEHHGGRLAVESEPGEGSCFRALLPTDLRRGEHWRVAQIADGLKLARAVGAGLSVVEVGVATCDSEGTHDAVELPFVAACLEECLRPSDVVVMGEGAATLVLYDVDRSGAVVVAERAVSAMARLFESLQCQGCSIRVGIASYPADGATAPELASAARRAMCDTPVQAAVAPQRARCDLCDVGEPVETPCREGIQGGTPR